MPAGLDWPFWRLCAWSNPLVERDFDLWRDMIGNDGEAKCEHG